MVDKALFSSATYEWETPDDLFKRWDNQYGFTLDPAASHENHKTPVYCTKDGTFTVQDDGVHPRRISGKDGLEYPWEGETVWLNPPYGQGIGLWVAKAAESRNDGFTTVCLLPVRTDTRWWQTYVIQRVVDCQTWEAHTEGGEADEVYFLGGRLKFKGAKNAAPFPSAIVVYRGLY